MTEITFDAYVDEWDALVAQIAKGKAQLKPLETKELLMRKAIAARVKEALGDQWKEGTNAYMLADLRNLKVVNKLTRKVDVSALPSAREEYVKLNDVPCTFDELLRPKFEIVKEKYDLLEGPAKSIFSFVVTTTESAPEVKLS